MSGPPSPEKLTGYTGLYPRVNQSGDEDRRGQRLDGLDRTGLREILDAVEQVPEAHVHVQSDVLRAS